MKKLKFQAGMDALDIDPWLIPLYPLADQIRLVYSNYLSKGECIKDLIKKIETIHSHDIIGFGYTPAGFREVDTTINYTYTAQFDHKPSLGQRPRFFLSKD